MNLNVFCKINDLRNPKGDTVKVVTGGILHIIQYILSYLVMVGGGEEDWGEGFGEDIGISVDTLNCDPFQTLISALFFFIRRYMLVRQVPT